MKLELYICNWIFYIIIIRGILRVTFRRMYSISKRNKDINYVKIVTFESTGYDFSMRLFTICIISFGLLYFITNNYSNNIIGSGVLVPIWLLLTGILARLMYRFVKLSYYGKYNKELTENEMKIYWIIIPILVNIVYLSYNFSLSLMITGIIIGKFLWLDTTIKLNEVKHIIVEYLNKNKQSIYVIIGFAMFVALGVHICNKPF